MNKERLLNVAKALRESKNPNEFCMARHVNACGTPACAFGHYAARSDLQSWFTINTTTDPYRFPDQGVYVVVGGEAVSICYDHEIVHTHFDLDKETIEQLFSQRGCNWAGTAIEAAEYIERFVEEY